jgi:hypothetical protein
MKFLYPILDFSKNNLLEIRIEIYVKILRNDSIIMFAFTSDIALIRKSGYLLSSYNPVWYVCFDYKASAYKPFLFDNTKVKKWIYHF